MSNFPSLREPPFVGGSNSSDQPQNEHSGSAIGQSSVSLVAGFLVAIVLLLAVEVHAIAQHRMLLATTGGFLMLLLVIFFVPMSEVAQALRGRGGVSSGPAPFVLALGIWSVVALVIAPYRGVAFAELIRALSGVGAFFVASYCLRPTPRMPLYTAAGLAGLAVLLAFTDFASIGRQGGLEGVHLGFFATHEEVGTLMLLPLPVMLALAFSPRVEERWRVTAFALSVALGLALLIAQCRASWIGGIAAALTLAFLLRRSQDRVRQQKWQRHSSREWRAYAVVGLVSLIVIAAALALSGVGTVLMQRAATLPGALSSRGVPGPITDRLLKWDGAARMAAERPVTGWGLGAYTVLQGRWTHQGHEVAEVLTRGSAHQNIAHNYYFQHAAETGIVGLSLHMAMLTAFLLTGKRALTSLLSPLSHALLIGCMAAAVGGAVDALGSPSYNYPGPFAIYMSLLGIGTAAMMPAASAAGAAAATAGRAAFSPLRAWGASMLLGIIAALLPPAVGVSLQRAGASEPRGVLRVEALPTAASGGLVPGTEVTWTAAFTDAQGKPVSTMPGVIWTVYAEEFVLRTARTGLRRTPPRKEGHYDSSLRIRLPATKKPVTVTATYRDFYGRSYEAEATVEVRSPSSKHL